MINEFTLNNISQDDVNQSERILMSLLRALPQYRNLDLRSGTALKDLLVRPQAELWALESLRLQFVQDMKSLRAMQSSGKTVSVDMINDVLANFNISLDSTSKAVGSAIVKLKNASDYTIGSGTIFRVDELEYITSQSYTFSRQPTTNQLSIFVAKDGTFYFIVPLEAVDYGVEYLIKEGEKLTPASSIYSLISVEAYADFTGATSVTDIADIIKTLPALTSHKSLESRMSIQSILTAPTQGNFPIRAISVVGAGDRTQLRDKHNYIGASAFGRVDIYPRIFESPTIVTLNKIGTRIAPDTYEITIEPEDAPGYYAVKSVSDADVVINPLFDFAPGLVTDNGRCKTEADIVSSTTSAFGFITLGSYAFEDIRDHIALHDIPHDISEDNPIVETAYTKYQKGKLIIHNVTSAPIEDHPFKLVLYTAPQIGDIQDYVDNPEIKNIKADYIVRSPLLCLVALRATIDVPADVTTTADQYKAILARYINSVSFTRKLTQGEIVGLLTNAGVKYINLSKDSTHGFRMEGRIRASDGQVFNLYGPDLDIEHVANDSLLVAPNTCVYATDTSNIFINLRKTK